MMETVWLNETDVKNCIRLHPIASHCTESTCVKNVSSLNQIGAPVSRRMSDC